MTKKELVLNTLEEIGYKPTIDEDGDIMVRYQMKKMYVAFDDDEEQYVSVIFPNFHEIEEGNETLALAACNKVTRDVKFIKVIVDPTFKQVSASCEFYYTDAESLKNNLEHSFEVLGVARSLFRSGKDELSD